MPVRTLVLRGNFRPVSLVAHGSDIRPMRRTFYQKAVADRTAEHWKLSVGKWPDAAGAVEIVMPCAFEREIIIITGAFYEIKT